MSCSALRPLTTWMTIFQMCFSFINYLACWHSQIRQKQSPSSANSITILQSQNKITYQRELECSSKNASLYDATNGFLMLARIRTSLRAFSFSLSDKLYILTFLRAQISPSSNRFTLYTLEQEPSPEKTIKIELNSVKRKQLGNFNLPSLERI